MGHAICGVVVTRPYSSSLADSYDLRPVLVQGPFTLFPIDHYWSAYWQARRGERDGQLILPSDLPAIFPTEGCVAAIVAEILGVAEPCFGLLMTDYFGGNGQQWAVLLRGASATTSVVTVNTMLRHLGFLANGTDDKWATFGLTSLRQNPDYLDVYPDLCEELGVCARSGGEQATSYSPR